MMPPRPLDLENTSNYVVVLCEIISMKSIEGLKLDGQPLCNALIRARDTLPALLPRMLSLEGEFLPSVQKRPFMRRHAQR
jgi:hypothetical protein